MITNGNGPTVWLAYRFDIGDSVHGTTAVVCSIWDSRARAEKYLETREKNDLQRGTDYYGYGVIPWKVSI